MGNSKSRPILVGGSIALLVFMLSAFAADSIEQRLAHAESIKRTNHAQFVAEIDALESDAAELNALQREQVSYLRGWQATFEGDYVSAISRFEELISSAEDSVVRFRSRSTMINALSLARRYTESFEQLNTLLEELPTQTEPAARAQALAVAAQLHNVVGQHEDSLRFTSQLLSEAKLPWVRCGAETVKVDSGLKSGAIRTVDAEIDRAIADCSRNREHLFAGLLRVSSAKLHLSNDQPLAALEALAPHESEILATQYGHLISDMAVQMARAHLLTGELDAAERRAQQAIDATRAGENTEPLAEAWRVLAEVASQRGDYVEAFKALQRNAEVERANLDDTGQRALAFQLARYRTQAQKLEIASLNQQNELLKLQQEVTTTAVQNARLSILLLLSVLGFGVVWAWRTRRMKQHFQRLAQSDSLTGAASRPHFMAQARQLLEKAERSGQNVGLIIMDLDFFKSVNDEHGHAVGDQMLQQAAACCLEGPGRKGLFGRLGGEEFAFLLPNTQVEAAIELAERCRQDINAIRYGPSEAGARLSASFGVAVTDEHGYELRELLIAADGALYEAKRKGRNRVVHLGGRPAAGRGQIPVQSTG
jgi:diguanylate cyclase (GGDEF)-like protein